MRARAPTYIDGAYFTGPVWMRLILRNSGDTPATWRLDYRDAWGDSVRVYWLGPDSAVQEILENRWQQITLPPRHDRLVATQAFSIQPHTQIEIWLEALSGIERDTSAYLAGDQLIAQHRQQEAGFTGLMLGLRITLTCIIIAFAAILKDRAALYFSFFVAGVTVHFLIVDGYFNLVDVGVPTLLNLYAVTEAVIWTSYLFALRSYTDSARRYPRHDRALLTAMVFGLGVMVCSAIFLSSGNAWLANVAYLLTGVGGIAFMALAVSLQLKFIADKGAGGKLLLLASTCLMMLGVDFVLRSLGVILIPLPERNYLVNIIMAGDGAIFAAALVYRAIGVRRERDQAIAARLKALQERAALAERLMEAREAHGAAVALAERRRRDLAATSHDLRQPLLSLQMALRGSGDANAAKGLSYIEHMLRRNLAETRSEADVSAEAKLPLQHLFANVALMFGQEAAARGVGVRAMATRLVVEGAGLDLMRILANLVANAIQHSGGSRVLIASRSRGGDLEVLVADNGRGVPPEAAAHIFEAYQAGTASQGQGLGLAIARELAEANGWKLALRSWPGRGALFVLSGVQNAATPPRNRP